MQIGTAVCTCMRVKHMRALMISCDAEMTVCGTGCWLVCFEFSCTLSVNRILQSSKSLSVLFVIKNYSLEEHSVFLLC